LFEDNVPRSFDARSSSSGRRAASLSGVAACWPLVIGNCIKATYDLTLLRMFRAIPSGWTPPKQVSDVLEQQKRGRPRIR
jgi:hypothetical protein